MQPMCAPDEMTDLASWRDHVLMCGLGSAGVRVTEGLLRAGARVVVIDKGPPTPNRRALAGMGVPVIEGDCTETETLQRAAIGAAQAVVVTINHDMVCLQAALAARELNPTARIVIRLFNVRMAQHLRDLPAGIIAISLSATAAPVFILAARCRALRGAFTEGGATWAIGSLAAPAGEPIPLEAWRRLGMVPLVCIAPGGDPLCCPSLDMTPPPGSTVLVAAQAEQLEAMAAGDGRLEGALREPKRLADQLGLLTPSDARRVAGVWQAVRTFRLLWLQANPLLRAALVALLGLVASGVLVFHWFYPLRFVDALYFTTTLITTVGLGDFNLAQSAAPLKLFGIMVMLGGTFLTAVVYGLIVDYVLNRRIDAVLGERLDSLQDHYVVAGLGTVGFRVVSALHEAGEQVVAVESSDNGRFVPQLRSLGVPLVLGDAALEETLRRAKFERARALIAVTNNDLVNIEAVLNARAMRPGGHVVLRVFDPDLATQARRSLAIPASFSASLIGAPAFVSAALGHQVPQPLRLPLDLSAGQVSPEVLLLHIGIAAGDGLCGGSIGDAAVARGGIAVLHLPHGAEGEVCCGPAPEVRLMPGDVLVMAVPTTEPGTNAPSVAIG
jgi:voltage-gated potassium channel Kch